MSRLALASLCILILSLLCADITFAQASAQSSVFIQVRLPNGIVAVSDSVSAGGRFRFSGLPFPLHYLNGGELRFPEGSLTDRVTITIEVPHFAKISSSSISFGDSMATAVRFVVALGDTPMSPYRFPKPVELTLPIPQNRPPTIGARISQLVLAYRDSLGRFDTTGIHLRLRDSILMIVKGEVSHFSDVVLTSSNFLTRVTGVTDEDGTVPQNFVLYQNYPNPFNPSTTIRFALPRASYVRLRIYNVIGHEITTLLNQGMPRGVHEVQWDVRDVPSGVYLYRLETKGFTQVKKLVVIK